MEIKDELPIAPASAGGGDPSQDLVSGDQFDVEVYTARYSGRTRVARLLFIAGKCGSERMELDALRLAYDASLVGHDTALHRDVVTRIDGRLGPRYVVDQAWSDAVERRSLVRKDKLDSELNGYKTNLITESILMGYNELADFHYAHGHLSEALMNYIRTADYCTTSKQVAQMCLNVTLVSIDLGQFMHVPTYVSKAQGTPDALDPLTIAKLRAVSGLAYLEMNEYKVAAEKFIETGSELRNNYAEIISPEDVALYGSLCAIASFDQSELKSKVLDNSNFRNFLELVPELRDLVDDFYASRYSLSLYYLEKLKGNLLLDIHLHQHVEVLYNDIFQKATKLENEFTALFSVDNIEARIDSLLRPSSATDDKDGTPKAEGTAEDIRFGLADSLAEGALGRILKDKSACIDCLHGNEPAQRAKLIRDAVLSVQASLPKDSVKFMNHAVVLEPHLSKLEKELFFVSTLRAIRCVKKSVHMLLTGSAGGENEAELAMLARYREKVQLEFYEACICQIGVINKYLLPNSVGEWTVSYHRLKGVVLEVLAQVDSTDQNHDRALTAYMAAVEQAEQQLCPSNHESLRAAIDLTLFLDFSMNETESAYMAGRKALDGAYPMLRRSTRDSDIIASRFLFDRLAGIVSKLSKKITGQEALLPYMQYWKSRTGGAASPEPVYRHCKSTGLDNSVIKLPSVHPEEDAYELKMLEEEEDSIYSIAKSMHI